MEKFAKSVYFELYNFFIDWCKKQMMVNDSLGIDSGIPSQQSISNVKLSSNASIDTPERPLNFPVPLISSLESNQNVGLFNGLTPKDRNKGDSTNEDVIIISSPDEIPKEKQAESVSGCDNAKHEQLSHNAQIYVENPTSPLNLSCKNDHFQSKLNDKKQNTGALKIVTNGKRSYVLYNDKQIIFATFYVETNLSSTCIYWYFDCR